MSLVNRTIGKLEYVCGMSQGHSYQIEIDAQKFSSSCLSDNKEMEKIYERKEK